MIFPRRAMFCKILIDRIFNSSYHLIMEHNVKSQKQKQFTTIINDDFQIEFSCIDNRRVAFYADKYNFDYNNSGITHLSSPNDKYESNLISPGKVWGNARVLYKIGTGDWIPVYDGDTKAENFSQGKVVYTDYEEGMPIMMERTIEMAGNGIDVSYRLKSMLEFPIAIGDFEIPFPVPDPPGEGYDPAFKRYNHDDIYENTFIRHQYIGGNSSYLYFTRRSGEPPFLLVMTKPGTSLEYHDGSSVFIHSIVSGIDDLSKNRIKNKTINLSPFGEEGCVIEYGLRYQWVNSYEEMRDVLYDNGLIDIRVVPGMTIPQGLGAKVSLHTRNEIDSIVAEYPDQTTIRYLESKEQGYTIFEVEFSQLGENLLTIYYNKGERSILEFFSTEDIETLVSKRSSFIVNKQQHRDPSKWYNGLYSVWDMENSVLRGPGNTDGYDFFYGFFLAGDDPALTKAPFLAAKNVYFPDDKEISSLEYHIENYVWGGLQRTDKELPNPYGIYSVPNWKVARDRTALAGIRNNNLDKMNICRNYDYPHLIMMYYHMFRIAKFYPEKVKYLDSQGYLERAFQTAKALYVYPYEIYPWEDTYKWGLMNELVILPLIVDLEENGRKKDADLLRNEWEKKVKYFVYDDKNPYHSEYCTGSTAMASAYAFAKYGTQNRMMPDKNLWYDTNLKKWWSHPEVRQEDSRLFMNRQLLANLAIRGCLIPAYYNFGTTPSLCYRSRLGGLGLVDYGREFSKKPWDWLQAGYASYLGSFALINSGTPGSNYGYWFPGEENDGAMGWYFNPGKESTSFRFGKNRTLPHGSHPYDGEGDLSNCAIFRMAETILTDDPVFGWISYGGSLENSKKEFSVVPKDGVRCRFSIITEKKRLSLKLDHDGFQKDEVIIVNRSLNEINFKVENRSGDRHITRLEVSSSDCADIELKVNGKRIQAERVSDSIYLFDLNIFNKSHDVELSCNVN